MTLVANANVILIIIGLLPWLARLTRRMHGLDVSRRPTSILCGVVVTAAQLFAGASGPLLDIFYLNARLDRYQVVATKALTQTLGHLLKLVYYGLIITVDDTPGPALFIVAMLTAVVGTRTGTRLLERIADAHFRRVSSYVILAIATACVGKGLAGIFLS